MQLTQNMKRAKWIVEQGEGDQLTDMQPTGQNTIHREVIYTAQGSESSKWCKNMQIGAASHIHLVSREKGAFTSPQQKGGGGGDRGNPVKKN